MVGRPNERRVNQLKRRFLLLCLIGCCALSAVVLLKPKIFRPNGSNIKRESFLTNILSKEEIGLMEFKNEIDYSDSSGELTLNTFDDRVKAGGQKEVEEAVDDEEENCGECDPEENDKIVILMWSKYYKVQNNILLKSIFSERQWDPKCCEGVEITLDRNQLEKATAVVIFHYFGNLDKNDLPPTRRPDQLWILYSKESPSFAPNLREFKDIFNWTMSYRQDSEIWAPYAKVTELETPSEIATINGIPIDEWISGKTHLLTVVVSHCTTPSKREHFIQRLKEDGNIPIDIYGACGTPICQRNVETCNHTAWWTALASKYKFYFSAENSLCTDYITEKFWRALELGMVPVAYGGGNYTAVAPPGSFIDTRDFISYKELAEYLLHLDRSPWEYKTYFEWRGRYIVRTTETWHAWCDLCKAVQDYKRKLEDDDPSMSSPPSRAYSDLAGWWTHRPAPENETLACLNFQ